MVKMEKNKIPIDLEVIKTPKGDVPTVNSFKSLIDGLNVLNDELNVLRGDYLSHIEDLRKDIKSIKKLIAEETITLESLGENLKLINEKLLKISDFDLEKSISEVLTEINKNINSKIAELKDNQMKMEESFVKALEIMANVVEMKLKIKKSVKK